MGTNNKYMNEFKVGEEVYYRKPKYGIHAIKEYDEQRDMFLLKIETYQFYAQDWELKKITE